MTARRNLLVLAGLIAAVALMSWLLVGQGLRLSPDPLSNAPSNAVAVGWADLPALRGSHLWQRLVVERGADRGMHRIEAACGFDPLAPITQVSVFVVGDGPDTLDRVGVMARGQLDHHALEACVRTVVTEQGGTIRETQIAGVPAIAGRGSSRAAFVGRDGLLGGDEETVAAIVEVLSGEAEAAAHDATLSRLRALVGAGRQVVLVAHVPPAWQGALRRRLRDSIETDLGALADLTAIGAGARVTDGLSLGVALQMTSAGAARTLARNLEAQVEQVLDNPMLSLTAAGPALRRLQVQPQEQDVILTLELSTSQIDGLIELVEGLWEAPAREERDVRPLAPRTPTPDEVLRPGRD